MAEWTRWTARILPGLSAALRADKAPYVVTLFIGALCWTGLRTSERLADSPMVEYQLSHQSIRGAGGDVFSYAHLRLRNTTHKKIFECFKIDVVSKNSSLIDNADNQTLTYIGNVGTTATVVISKNSIWQWSITNFAPGADIILGIPMVGFSLPKLLVRPCSPTQSSVGPNAPDSPPPPTLIERSMVTFYVEHEMPILWAGLMFWLLTLVALNSLNQPTPILNTSIARRLKKRNERQ